MRAPTAEDEKRRAANGRYRFVRRIHAWIGAWGALAAILYGFTGLVMNHRLGEWVWPQGSSAERATETLAVPAEAADSAERLSLWLRQTRGLDADVIRKPPAKAGTPARWTLIGGSATQSWSLEYSSGEPNARLAHQSHSMLAALNRLHKTVGGGLAWRLLADSFALGLILLGLSGLWMWAKGRDWREMVFSVLAVSLLTLAVVVGPMFLA